MIRGRCMAVIKKVILAFLRVSPPANREWVCSSDSSRRDFTCDAPSTHLLLVSNSRIVTGEKSLISAVIFNTHPHTLQYTLWPTPPHSLIVLSSCLICFGYNNLQILVVKFKPLVFHINYLDSLSRPTSASQ